MRTPPHSPLYKACRLIAVLALTAATDAQSAEMPASTGFSVGDTWEWRQIDMRTKLETGKRQRTVVKADDALKFSYSGKVEPISIAFVGTPATQPWRVWPLEVGKRWTYEADWKRADGMTGNTRQEAEVVAFENVTVPAGQFMAYKIVYKGWYRSRSGTGKQDDTYWYAPDVKADVAHTRDDNFNMYRWELTKYEAGKP